MGLNQSALYPRVAQDGMQVIEAARALVRSVGHSLPSGIHTKKPQPRKMLMLAHRGTTEVLTLGEHNRETEKRSQWYSLISEGSLLVDLPEPHSLTANLR